MLISPNPTIDEWLGESVAFAGGVVAVGAPQAETGAINSGAVYLFSPPVTQDDAQRCYKAKTVRDTPRFQKLDVTLTDEFESKATTLKRPAFLCDATSRDDRVVEDPSAGMTCYKIKDVKGQPKFEREEILTVNAYGVGQLTLRKPSELCVPSGRDGAPIPGSDAYKCYKGKTSRGWPIRFAQRDELLADEFETKLTTVKKPYLYCAPVDVNGGGTLVPENALACYKGRDAKGEPKFAGANVQSLDEFGQLELQLVKGQLVCVPTQGVRGIEVDVTSW